MSALTKYYQNIIFYNVVEFIHQYCQDGLINLFGTCRNMRDCLRLLLEEKKLKIRFDEFRTEHFIRLNQQEIEKFSNVFGQPSLSLSISSFSQISKIKYLVEGGCNNIICLEFLFGCGFQKNFFKKIEIFTNLEYLSLEGHVPFKSKDFLNDKLNSVFQNLKKLKVFKFRNIDDGSYVVITKDKITNPSSFFD